MATQSSTCYSVRCDICREPLRFDDDGMTAHFETRRHAEQAAADFEWTRLGRGRIACRTSDPAHDDARDAVAIPAT